MILKTIFIVMTLMNTSFEHQENDPHALFPFKTASREIFPTGNQSNPAYINDFKAFTISSFYSKPYSIEGLTHKSGNILYSNKTTGFSTGYSSFGIKEYREDFYNMQTGFKINNFSFGSNFHYNKIIINTEELTRQLNFYGYDLSARIIFTNWLHISSRFNNINSIFDKKKKDLLFPGKYFGITIEPASGISFSYNHMINDFKSINSIIISFNILPNINLATGYSRETTEMSLSINSLVKNIRLSYGFRYHTYLGYTHMVGAIFSYYEYQLKPIKFIKPILKSSNVQIIAKQDIQKCKTEDLKLIKGLETESIERIIKYKKIFKNITTNSLYQLGLSKNEIKIILLHYDGFLNKRSIKQLKLSRKPRKAKELFIKLIEKKVPPLTTLTICENYKIKNKISFCKYIRSSNELDNNTKKFVLNLCTK